MNKSFIQYMRLWETSPDVRPYPAIQGSQVSPTQLLGVDSVRLWQDQTGTKKREVE